MRWTAIRLTVVCLSVIVLSGCKSGQKQSSVDPAYDTGELYTATPSTSTYQTTSYPAYGAPATSTTTYDAGAGLEGTMGSRSHTVAKGDTLYQIARSYYGDQRRWKEIYEANRSTIGGNPNQIRVGQKLVIP